MHVCAGLDSVTSGRVFVGDVDLTTLKDNDLTKLRRESLGFVFQSLQLGPHADSAGEHHLAHGHRRPQT